MGAWAVGPFDNDTAGDFIDELIEAPDRVEMLRRTLTATAEGTGELAAFEGCETVAAAAVLAVTLAGQLPWVSALDTEDTLALGLSSEQVTELAPLGVRALTRVLSPESELMELWEEAEDEDFEASTEALCSILTQAAGL